MKNCICRLCTNHGTLSGKQGRADKRPKGLRVGATKSTEWCQRQVVAFRHVFSQIGGISFRFRGGGG